MVKPPGGSSLSGLDDFEKAGSVVCSLQMPFDWLMRHSISWAIIPPNTEGRPIFNWTGFEELTGTKHQNLYLC